MFFRFIMLGRSEPCRGRFSIFEKKKFIFSFERQKADLLTFCAKISSDRRIWPNRHWNCVEWTQEMVFNTYHHTRTCLDEKMEIDEKNFRKIFSLPISLRVTLKLSLRSRFSSKNHFFVFCRKFGFNFKKLSNHYSQLKKTSKSWPRNKIPWLSDENSRKNPMLGKCP